MNNKTLGDKGEQAAEQYIQGQGMRILQKNFRIWGGEIDLIAMDGDTLVFLEVKTRRGRAFGTGAEAIGPKKKQVLLRTAEVFAAQTGQLNQPMRFDVADIYVDENGNYNINYIKNADMWE